MTIRFLIILFTFSLMLGFAQQLPPPFPLIHRNYSMAEIQKGGQRQLELSKARVAALRVTDPRSPDRDSVSRSASVLLITWPTNLSLVIQQSTDLANWKNIATNAIGSLVVTNERRMATLIAPYMTRINYTNMDHKTVGGRVLYYNGGTYFRGVVTGTNTNTQSITLAWDASIDPSVTTYKVYWGVAPSTYTNSVNVGGLTTATVPGLVAGATYCFGATALNVLSEESEFSNEFTYTVPSVPPFRLTIK